VYLVNKTFRVGHLLRVKDAEACLYAGGSGDAAQWRHCPARAWSRSDRFRSVCESVGDICAFTFSQAFAIALVGIGILSTVLIRFGGK
jgi:hypothetical protein